MLTIAFLSYELTYILRHARRMELGGRSQVRTQERLAHLQDDQYVAALGEAALSKFLTGSIDLWIRTRQEKELRPEQGDGGSDLLGLAVDIKTSRMRAGTGHEYHLWVRPQEYHPGVRYYLGLVPPGTDDLVHLLGWAQAEQIPFRSGRYDLPASFLNPMFNY